MPELIKRGMLSANLLLLALLVLCPGGSQEAAAEELEMDTVRVTATRVEKDLFEVPASVSVVTEEEIQENPTSSLAELLRDIPGVEVHNNSGIKRVMIRGESAQRVLVLIDGQKITEQKSMDGAPLLIDPSRIERIEVIKGPASVLYGSEAIGGVVNIITKKGAGKPVQLETDLRFDTSNQEFFQTLALAGTVNGVGYRISEATTAADNLRTADGTVDDTDYDKKEFAAYLDYTFDSGKIGIAYDYYDSETSLPGQSETDFSLELDLPEWSREKYSAFAEFTPDLSGTWLSPLVKTRFDISYQNTLKDFYNNMMVTMGPWGMLPVNVHTKNDLDDLNVSLQTDWVLGNHYLILGGELIHSELDADQVQSGESPAGMPPNTAAYEDSYVYEAELTTYAAYLQDEISFGEDWALTLGGRYTHVRGELSDTDDPDIETDSHSDNNVVVSCGLVYKGIENWSLRAQYAQGYLMPNLQQLYIGTVHGSSSATLPNSDLDPETSDNFEIGARYGNGRLSLDTALFYNRGEDYITIDDFGTYNQYVNVDKAETYGWELSASYAFAAGLTPYTELSLSRREFETGGESTRHTGLAPFQGRTGVRYDKALPDNLHFFADLFSRYACETKEESLSSGELDRYPGWATVNLSLGVKGEFGKEHSWHTNLVLGNLFDKDYRQARETIDSAGIHAIVAVGMTF
jgi:hemoglobin/transferrin/lactoferrin receptor protein